MNVRFVNFQQLANGIYKDIIHLNIKVDHTTTVR